MHISSARKIEGGVLLAGLLTTLLFSIATAAPGFSDPGFANIWKRADLPVEQLGAQLGRGYTWGPAVPEATSITGEIYNGTIRKVQYFDKARMEVNNLQANPSDPYYVTTGLLVKELVTGSRQDGDKSFKVLAPSTVQIAGDSNLDGKTNQIAPTYASFRGVGTFAATENGQSEAKGQPIVNSVNKGGQVTTLTTPPETRLNKGFDAVTRHNIADVFVDFMNQNGLIWNGQQIAQGQVLNGLYVIGRPLTEPYWVRVVVVGQQRDVLVQLFERRVLTYTPANPAAYRTEMGNVGQHYWAWRYVEHGDSNPPDLFPAASNQPNAAFNQNGPIPTGGPNNTQLYKLNSPSWVGLSQDGKIALTETDSLSKGKTNSDLVALNLGSDGRIAGERWRIPYQNWIAKPLLYKDTAYFPTLDYTVVAVDLNSGKVKWTYQLPDRFAPINQAITDGNKLYFVANEYGGPPHGEPHPDGRLYAVRLFDGKLAWQTPALGATNGPSFAFDGNILFSSDEGNLYLYTRQGTSVNGWPFQSRSRNYIYAEGVLYNVPVEGHLQTIDANGKVIKDVTLPDSIKGEISAVVNGRIYINKVISGGTEGYATRLTALSTRDLQTVEFSYDTSGFIEGGLVIVDNYIYFSKAPPGIGPTSEKQLTQVSATDPKNNRVLLKVTLSGSELDTPIVNRGHVYTSDPENGVYVIS